MTVGPNYICKYEDLIEYAIEQLKSKCHNIDEYSIEVPKLFTNKSFIIAQESISRVASRDHALRDGFTAKINVKTSDSLLQVVSSDTIINQINEFMSERGLFAKKDTVVSFKAMVNFFQNLAVFMEAKLIEVYSPYEGTAGIIFYNPDGVVANVDILVCTPTYYDEYVVINYPVEPFNINNPKYEEVQLRIPVNQSDEEISMSSEKFIDNVTNLLESLNSIKNIHHVQTTLTVNCCSSCSSSSSSSSSCSSSSSAFIVYMDI